MTVYYRDMQCQSDQLKVVRLMWENFAFPLYKQWRFRCPEQWPFFFLQSLNVRIRFGPWFWLTIDLSDSEKRQPSCHDLTLCTREMQSLWKVKSHWRGLWLPSNGWRKAAFSFGQSMVLSGHRARTHSKWLTDGPEGRLLTTQLSQLDLRVGPGRGPHDNNRLPFESHGENEVQSCFVGPADPER